jgi:hypothetical protein
MTSLFIRRKELPESGTFPDRFVQSTDKKGKGSVYTLPKKAERVRFEWTYKRVKVLIRHLKGNVPEAKTRALATLQT